MSDFRMREIKALLNTTMESVLKRAVFEIMKIVENSIHDHQLELAQKGEEIVQLKVKLQSVEMKLRDAVYANDPAQIAQIDKQFTKVQEGHKGVTKVTTPMLVPETDFEIPEDWCAPVGEETLTNPNDGVCPSVRLRQLSIPLYPIPIAKQEEDRQDIESHQGAKILRRSKRGLPVEKNNQALGKSLKATDRKAQVRRVRRDVAKMLQENVKQGVDLGSTGRRTTSPRNQQGVPSPGKVRESAAAESKPAEQKRLGNDGALAYQCGFCSASFESEFGREVHERCHRWCKGCKTHFSSPDSLTSHKSQCKKLQALLAKKARSKAASGPVSNQATLNSELVNNEQDSANNSQSASQNNGLNKGYSCVFCGKRFGSGARLRDHMRVHTGEKPFSCSFCSKKFRIKQSLKNHMMKTHKNEMKLEPTKVALALTMPLTKNTGHQDVNQMSTKVRRSRKNSMGIERGSIKWKEYGTKVPGGYSCNLCKKFKKNKGVLVEHYRVHTGEKPFKCPTCQAAFRFRGQYSSHYKKCRGEHHKDTSAPTADSPPSSNV